LIEFFAGQNLLESEALQGVDLHQLDYFAITLLALDPGRGFFADFGVHVLSGQKIAVGFIARPVIGILHDCVSIDSELSLAHENPLFDKLTAFQDNFIFWEHFEAHLHAETIDFGLSPALEHLYLFKLGRALHTIFEHHSLVCHLVIKVFNLKNFALVAATNEIIARFAI